MPRTPPPVDGDERDTLLGFLTYLRETMAIKTEGLDAAQLTGTLPPSDLTLGGMLSHLAFVEDYWWTYVFAGEDPAEPWRSAPWDDDEDFDWHLATQRTPAELTDMWSRAVTDQERHLPPDLDTLSARERHGERVSARWILVHLIEEYARHAGHADLIRQSIDGAVGE